MKKLKAIIVSGYFNPIHKGHIEYFRKARELGDLLLVIVNNDFQVSLKGSKEFQLESERMLIVEQLKLVDQCFLSIDKDRTVRKTIRRIESLYRQEYSLAFANGGDQKNELSPERPICEELGIELIDNLGDKIQSSSWLLKNN